jgi:anti-sigma regulatory factor (Ser/Thr protein kinase)
MPGQNENKSESRLTLLSRLSELALVWPWVEALAAEHSITDKTQYAIQLCLEEVLSNIIRHGYHAEPDHTVTVDFASIGKTHLAFTIEDHAPPFNPIQLGAMQAAHVPRSLLDIQPGGKGIQLLRKFSDSLVYEELPNGNRLTVCFSATHAKIAG